VRPAFIVFILLSFNTNFGWTFDLLNTAKQITEPKPAASSQTSSITTAITSSLTGLLTSGLDVSPEQASGGLGSLFSVAQSSLSAQDFSSLSSYVPDMSSLLKAAPAVSENSSSSLLGSFGGMGDTLNASSKVASQFTSLGLSAEHIPQYISIINDYLQSQGGQQAVNLFSKGIAALL
jgi:hypothetical protein